MGIISPHRDINVATVSTNINLTSFASSHILPNASLAVCKSALPAVLVSSCRADHFQVTMTYGFLNRLFFGPGGKKSRNSPLYHKPSQVGYRLRLTRFATTIVVVYVLCGDDAGYILRSWFNVINVPDRTQHGGNPVGSIVGTKKNIFVSYAYSEGTRASAPSNLGYFLRYGITVPCAAEGSQCRKRIQYGIVVNGNCVSSYCLSPGNYVQPAARRNVREWRRDNVGYDFGAHSHVLNALSLLGERYEAYIFLNCGVVGPIVPVYMPNSWHWTDAFADKLRGQVGLVGTSIVCLPVTDLGGYGPSVEGFAFALSYEALNVVLTKGSSFQNHASKADAILDGEYALTDTVIQNGFSIDSLLKAYEKRDWLNKSGWNCNNFKHPSREGTYFGISIHPLEVIFHKVSWGSEANRGLDAPENRRVTGEATDLYMRWRDSNT
jgi:hypothetical protein